MKKLKTLIRDYLEDALSPDASKPERFFILLNLLLPVFMGLYVFLNPMPLSSISEILFYSSVVVLLFLIFFKKTEFTLRTPLTLPYALFLIWVIIGLFFTLDFKNSIHDIRAHLLAYWIIFYLLVNYFNSKKKLEALSWVIILSVTFFSIGAIIIYYFIEGFSFNERLGGTFKEMYTGWMCLITVSAIPLMLNELYRANTLYSRLLLTFGFLITTIATLLNQSRAALIGIMVALLIMCMDNKKNIILVVITIFFMVLIPGIRERVSNKGLDDIRSNINRLSIEIIKDYHLTGVGFGMQIFGNPDVLNLEKYNQRLPKQYQQHVIRTAPHNIILDIAVRTGIIGLLLFSYILICALFMIWQVWKQTKNEDLRSWAICLLACLASFMTQSLFNDTTYNSRAVAFYTILAMITILWNLVRENQPASLNN